MSKERKLLALILSYAENKYLTVYDFEMINEIEETFKNIKELLTQPESTEEPVAWILEEKATAYKTQVAWRPSVLKKGWEAIPLYPDQEHKIVGGE